MQTRPFGASQIPISPLSFGSMRLSPARTAKRDAVRLFERLHDCGVTTFHSSYEYDSFEYFCECLAAFRQGRPGAQVRHIVKLPAPHFDEPGFSAEAFMQRVDRYLQALGAERLDVVQWLVRQSPNTPENRAKALSASAPAMSQIWERLRREGKVGALASFPYDPKFAEHVLDVPPCEGLVAYLNLAEPEYAGFVEKTSLIAIRPLFAGLLTSSGLTTPADEEESERRRRMILDVLADLGVPVEEAASFAVQFCLMHENVSSVIVGMSSEEHAEPLLKAVENVRTSGKAFHEIAEILANARAVSC